MVRSAKAVYLAGDSPMHLRSVLKDTPVFDALQQIVVDGGVVAAVGQSANGLCDPMTDPRGGAFTLGLGLVSGLALITEVEGWSHDRLARTVKLASGKVPLVSLATGTALLRDGSTLGTGRGRRDPRRTELVQPLTLGDGDGLGDDLLARRHAVDGGGVLAERVQGGDGGVEPVGDLTEQRVVGLQRR